MSIRFSTYYLLNTVQYGCQKAPLVPLVTVIAELNKKVPSFPFQKGHLHLRFPNDKHVQKPLQDIYSLFINLYLFILSYLKSEDYRESNSCLTFQWNTRTDRV